MKKILLLFVLLLGVVSSSMAQGYIDVLYLKDGSVIRGQVIEQVPDKSLKIKTYDGSVFVYSMDMVERIVKEPYSNRADRKYNRDYTPENKTLRGYKGFIDAGYTFGDDDRFEMSTSHGYQFNNYIFVGGGMGVHIYEFDNDGYASVPIFANFRANFINKKTTPFADVKAGYSYGDIEGAYASIGVGVRLALAKKMALNFSLSFTAQDFEWFDAYYDGGWYYYDDTSSGVSLKVGFEF